MNKRTLKRAIGVSNGKTLTIVNDCASASIELERVEFDGGRVSVRYFVTGDVGADKGFSSLERALSYAVKGLAEYMDGSLNR